MFKNDKKISEKVDQHTHVPIDKLTLSPSFPNSIKIELTANCNYKCSFCALKSNLREKRNINEDFLYRILKEAKEIGVKEIGMLYRKLPKAKSRVRTLKNHYSEYYDQETRDIVRNKNEDMIDYFGYKF